MQSFDNKKELKFLIKLGTGTYNSSGSNDFNIVELSGFRSVVYIDKAGGVQTSTMQAKIFGVSQSDMNSITTLKYNIGTTLQNTVEVYAIDGPVETLVFFGNIVESWGDYEGMPDVYLHIQAQAVLFDTLKPVSPRSFKGSIDVAYAMSQIVRSMNNYSFEDNGVNVQITDLYLPNTAMEQAKSLAKAANIDLYIDDKTIAITPKNTARGSIIPEISSTSGLVGYPTINSVGVYFKCLFNPSITFGGKIKLKTDIQRANGEWVVSSMSHHLEAEKPGGAWFSQIMGTQDGLSITK